MITGKLIALNINKMKIIKISHPTQKLEKEQESTCHKKSEEIS